MEMVRERDASVDLLRLIAMFAVVMLHVNMWLGVDALYESMFIYAVDLFGVITGYVCITSSWKLRRFVALWLQVVFYSVGMSVIGLCLMHYGLMQELPLAKVCLLPIPLAGGYWYFTAYAGLFFCIPFLNMVLTGLGERTFRTLVYLGVFVLPCASLCRGECEFLHNGYNVTWLGVLYVLGAYLRRFPVRVARVSAFGVYCLCVLGIWVGTFLWGDSSFNIVWPLCSMAAAGLFVAIRGVVLSPCVSSVIRRLAPYAFGVYLVHLHPVAWVMIQKSVGFCYCKYAPGFWWYVPVVAVAIFVSCLVVDWCRAVLFRWLGMGRLEEVIVSWCPRWIRHLEDVDAACMQK